MFSLTSSIIFSSLLVSTATAWNFDRAGASSHHDALENFRRANSETYNNCPWYYSAPGYYVNLTEPNVQINQRSVQNRVTATSYTKLGVDPQSLRVNTFDTKFATFNGTVSNNSSEMPGSYGFVSATQGNTHTSTMDLTGTYFTFDDSIKASYNMIVDGNMTSPHKFEMSDDNKKITLTVTSVADKSGDYSDFWVDRVQLVCHPPPPTYTTTFSGLTSRTVDDKHYIGKSFSDSESGCRAQCNSKDDCAFVNTYRNVPKGADDSSRWTCAFFSRCTHVKSATDSGKGGRSIKRSSGYCKDA